MSKYTLIIAAVLIEDIALLKFLRKNGSNLNQTNSYNQTALHAAFRYNKVDAAKYLLAIPEAKKDSRYLWHKTYRLGKIFGL